MTAEPASPFAPLAEMLAAALNPSCAGGDHAAIYLERCVVRWLMKLLGFPTEGSMGLLVSGGSMASLTQPGAAVPAHRGRQGVRRPAPVLGVRLSADARLSRAQALVNPAAGRQGRAGAGGETFLTQTTLDGRFSLRACVVHYATTEADLRLLLDMVRREGARLSASI